MTNPGRDRHPSRTTRPSEPAFRLTEGTVESHLARVHAELDVDFRTSAVATGIRLGLIRR
ncbi:hypothetical protein [Streptomyces venezuelae]|uniref:hypothetical protein n=1 Tax=Streptomyces venezuelae TaxID=54571 RepID=UPI00378F25CF